MDVKRNQNVSFGAIVKPNFSTKTKCIENKMEPFFRYLKTVGGDSFEHNPTIRNGYTGVSSFYTDMFGRKIAIGGFEVKGEDASNSEKLIKLAKIQYEKIFGFLPNKHVN